MALKKINVRFAPGHQVQLMLEPAMIDKIKSDGASEGREFAGQVRWILSGILGVPPLKGKKMIDTLGEQTSDMSGHIRALLEGYYSDKGISF